MRQIRLSQISLIPQGAMNSLNPVVRIKNQISDGLRVHDKLLTGKGLEKRIHEVLDWVDLDRAVAGMYPHELSGGMKQRVCIAIAISLHPRLIIADEPTSALDVVVQKQVMETIARLQAELKAAVILIGHDMGLMVQFVDRLVVMYGGKVAEMGDISDIFTGPLHPYTQALIGSLPTFDGQRARRGIPGVAPSLLNAPPGCVFHPRCSQVMEICLAETPSLREMKAGQCVACHLYRSEIA
jgi:peptide/nickel transport system ATP-binding protein